ncbi:hypothetical protein ScPMuIL_008772 [Solemya velum]
MPFMKGRAPIRRTLQYLEKGNMIFKENIRVLTVNYNTGQKASEGAYDFVFWNLAQIQYKNPAVQIVTLKNMTPSPFLQFFFNNGKKIVVDVDCTPREQILDHVKDLFCKTEKVLEEEKLAQMKTSNPANFGWAFPRWCICEVPGQVPCPGWVPLPKHCRMKYQRMAEEENM